MANDAALTSRMVNHIILRRDVRDNSKIRLSGAGSCSRQLGYTVIAAPKEADPLGVLVTFEIGHSYHAMTQKWLVDMGLVRPEFLEYTMVDEGRRIRGTCDGITERLNEEGCPDPAGKRRMVEIKSISNLPRTIAGKEVRGSFTCLEKPKDHHIDQATCYAAVWNEKHPDDPVTHLTFIYVAKDGAELDMPIRVFTQALSAKRWDRLQRKFERIWESLDAGEVPARDYDPHSQFSPCRFCRYLGLCLEADASFEEE